MDPYHSMYKNNFNCTECKILFEICEYQQYKYNTMNFYFYNFIFFIYKEKYIIVNPFRDKTGKYLVDPILYYGDYFLNSNFVSLIKNYNLSNYTPKSKCKNIKNEIINKIINNNVIIKKESIEPFGLLQ